jgi:hypothetical protein
MLVLGLAALAALHLASSRPSRPDLGAERRRAARVLAFAAAIQGLHFAEEGLTGFHEALGPLLGLPPMSPSFFVTFNVGWLGIWIASVPGLLSARRPAFFAAWFLAIAGMVNGVAHPLLAVAAGGYFPGVVSAPFIAIASIWLWRTLRGATRPEGEQAASTA